MVKKGFTISHNGISVDPSKKIAQTNMRFQIPTQMTDDHTKAVLSNASLWYYGNPPVNTVQDNVPVPNTKPILTDDRYITATFRGLSQIFLPNRGLDFSKPGVLEASVGLLKNKTVYPNHDFTDIYKWLGVVSNAYWDAKGDKSGGVPGINCEIKLDAFLNYRIACGVMMNPPAINSMSLTVLFEFEYSHPQLVEERRFWNLLGEEVEGDIVRMIVTKVIDYWEASLVFLGEDRLAKNHGTEPEDETQDETQSFSQAKETLPANSKQEKTMKLTKEQKAKLGIEFDGDDVPESEILKAAETLATANTKLQPANLAELQKQAASAETLMTARRAEVTRLAKIAEHGAAEGDLDEVVSMSIANADAETIVKLESYYAKKAAAKFPDGGRSSLESSKQVEGAGGVGNPAPRLKNSTGGLV